MKRYFGYQFKQAVEELTRKIAKEFGSVTRDIVWSANIPTAGTNVDGDIYFADVADDAILYDIDVQRYVGFAVHEMLHRKYTDFSINSDNSYLDQLHNAVEDAWIEHTGIDAKLTGNISGLLTALIDQIVGEANATVKDWTNPAQYPFIFAVYLRRHLNTYVPVPEGLEPIIHGAALKVEKCKSSKDTMAVAKWIMNQLHALPNTPTKKPGDKPSNKPSEPQSGSGKGEGKGKPSNRLDGNPHPSPGKAGAPKPSQQAREVEPSLHRPDEKAGSGLWNEGAYLGESKQHTRYPWLTEQPTVPARLRYEVKRLFDNSGMEDFQRNRRSGAINVNALHKIGITDKLFQRRHEVEGIDSAVVICLDVSGSMFEDGKHNKKWGVSNRIVQAALTTRALLDALHRSQVATSVITFGSMSAVLKPFGEHPSKTGPKLNGLRPGGSTNDYFAVRYAHRMLLQRPEQRKIAFVITDGIGRAEFVRKQCEAGERLGVTTIGIGIEMKVDKVYPNAIHVNDMAELATVSFKQIKLAM
jgi:hypothetical protein